MRFTSICGFFEAVADRETEAVGGGQGAEDGGDVAVIEFAEAGEEGLGEGREVAKLAPRKDFGRGGEGPAVGEHDSDGLPAGL